MYIWVVLQLILQNQLCNFTLISIIYNDLENIQIKVNSYNEIVSNLPSSQSGTFVSDTIKFSQSVTYTINFEKAFTEVPTIICSVVGNSSTHKAKYTLGTVTKVGFTITLSNTTAATDQKITLTWTATTG